MKTVFKIGVLIVVAAIFAALTLPPLLEVRRANAAIADLEILADAARNFAHHTGQPCPNTRALMENPGIPTWKGPYLSDGADLLTPWGDEYVIDKERGLVGISPTNERVPEKYRLGGIAELSMPAREQPQWWSSNAPR